MMSHRNVRGRIVGTLVFVVAIVAFFFAWAAADALKPTPRAATVFSILSFPVFTITSRRLANGYFWELALLNCLFWAACAVWLMGLWKKE